MKDWVDIHAICIPYTRKFEGGKFYVQNSVHENFIIFTVNFLTHCISIMECITYLSN